MCRLGNLIFFDHRTDSVGYSTGFDFTNFTNENKRAHDKLYDYTMPCARKSCVWYTVAIFAGKLGSALFSKEINGIAFIRHSEESSENVKTTFST